MKSRPCLRPVAFLAVLTLLTSALPACSTRSGGENTAASGTAGDGMAATARTADNSGVGVTGGTGPAAPFGAGSPFGGISRPGSSSVSAGSGTGIGGGFGAGGGYR